MKSFNNGKPGNLPHRYWQSVKCTKLSRSMFLLVCSQTRWGKLTAKDINQTITMATLACVAVPLNCKGLQKAYQRSIEMAPRVNTDTQTDTFCEYNKRIINICSIRQTLDAIDIHRASYIDSSIAIYEIWREMFTILCTFSHFECGMAAYDVINETPPWVSDNWTIFVCEFKEGRFNNLLMINTPPLLFTSWQTGVCATHIRWWRHIGLHLKANVLFLP